MKRLINFVKVREEGGGGGRGDHLNAEKFHVVLGNSIKLKFFTFLRLESERVNKTLVLLLFIYVKYTFIYVNS